MNRYLIAGAALCIIAPNAYAGVFELPTSPLTERLVQPEPRPSIEAQKSPACDDLVNTQLQTLTLLSQQLQATNQLGLTQVEILRAIQRLEAAQHPVTK